MLEVYLQMFAGNIDQLSHAEFPKINQPKSTASNNVSL